MKSPLIIYIVIAIVALAVGSFVVRALVRVLSVVVLIAACAAGYYFYKHGHANVGAQIHQLINNHKGVVSQLQKQIGKYVNSKSSS